MRRLHAAIRQTLTRSSLGCVGMPRAASSTATNDPSHRDGRGATCEQQNSGEPYEQSASASSETRSGENAQQGRVKVQFPVVQLPARSLWTRQQDLDMTRLDKADFNAMVDKLIETRKYYQYPSMSAPQIGWNVRVFTLFDGSVWVNPEVLAVNCPVPELSSSSASPTDHKVGEVVDGRNSLGGGSASHTSAPSASTTGRIHFASTIPQPVRNCWAWEPCASCASLMHYIERPATCRIRALDRHGRLVERVLDNILARFALHEMDHMDGVLFTRRIPNTDHVVLLEGFASMSDWCDDFPSLEARSTYLYNTFTPPLTFIAHSVEDANILDRKFQDGVYPGMEFDEEFKLRNAGRVQEQRLKWRIERDTLEEMQQAESNARMTTVEFGSEDSHRKDGACDGST